MKFWTVLPYVMLLVAFVHTIYPAQHLTLNDVEVDILMATAVLLFAIDRSKQ